MALERLLIEHYIGHGWTVKIYVLQSMLVMMVIKSIIGIPVHGDILHNHEMLLDTVMIRLSNN